MNTPSLPEPNQPILLAETRVKFHIDGNLTSASARGHTTVVAQTKCDYQGVGCCA